MLGTAFQGWRLLARDWLILLRIAWLPLGVVVALDFHIAGIWVRQLENPSFTDVDYATSGIKILTDFDMGLALLFGGFMVALWHRVQVSGRQVLSIFGLLAAWRNIAALTVHWCGLILITIGLMWVFNSVLAAPGKILLERLMNEGSALLIYPVLYGILAELILQPGPALAAFYISGRLGLMLWARPAGGKGAVEGSWAAGNGNGWRIAAAIFMAILPVILLEVAMQPLYTGISHLYYWPASNLSNLLQLFVAVGVISAAHRALLGGEDAADAMAST